MLVVILAISLFHVTSAGENCSTHTESCSSCINNGDNCYWCPDTSECLEWNWNTYPHCTGSKYFYGQCNFNGVSIIVVFSVVLFLLLVTMVVCCVCCCRCCKKGCRKKEPYVLLVPSDQNRPRRNNGGERQRLFQARRVEIRQNYGVITNDPSLNRFSSSL